MQMELAIGWYFKSIKKFIRINLIKKLGRQNFGQSKTHQSAAIENSPSLHLFQHVWSSNLQNPGTQTPTPPPSHSINFPFSLVMQGFFEIHRGCIFLHAIGLKTELFQVENRKHVIINLINKMSKKQFLRRNQWECPLLDANKHTH